MIQIDVLELESLIDEVDYLTFFGDASKIIVKVGNHYVPYIRVQVSTHTHDVPRCISDVSRRYWTFEIYL